MPALISPSLREYLERILEYEHKLSDQRFELLNAARDVQARELARRLDELNHAHQQMVSERQRTLPREIFEQFEREYRDKHGQVEQWQNRIDGGLMLLRIGGLAGVLSLLYGMLHLMGVVK